MGKGTSVSVSVSAPAPSPNGMGMGKAKAAKIGVVGRVEAVRTKKVSSTAALAGVAAGSLAVFVAVAVVLQQRKKRTSASVGEAPGEAVPLIGADAITVTISI
jgi:hypothetical protein